LPFQALSIVDEQNKFLVIDKPPGLPVHQTTNHKDSTLVDMLRSHFDDRHLYPCHRLDKVTSGLLLVAKGITANKALSQYFEQRKIEKYYLAISNKKPSKKQGLIKGDMKQARNGCWKLMRTMLSPATTQFFSYGLETGHRLFVLRPHTGKTHQIRVAMKSLGCPILGDIRYGGSEADRCYLHAFELGFEFEQQLFSYRSMPQFGTHFQCLEKLQSIGTASALHWPVLKASGKC